MKPRIVCLHLASTLVITLSSAHAIDIIKGNNSNGLTDTLSWVGGVLPGAADVAVWDATVSSVDQSALPGLNTNSTFGGIRIANPVSNVGFNVNSGRALSIGTSGIDMSAATANLTIGGAGILRPTASSTSAYNVASGRTLTIDAIFQAASGTTLVNFPGAGATNINKLPASTSLRLINTGSGTLTIGGTGTTSTTELSASSTSFGGKVIINGPTINTSTLGSYGNTTGTSSFELQSGGVNFNAAVRITGGDGSLIKVSGGAFTATTLTVGRSSNLGFGSNAPASSGFVTTGGTASIASLLIGTSNSSATARVDGGVVTVTTGIVLGNTTGTRWNTLQVNNGSLTVSGSSGIQISTNNTVANASQVRLTGGITTTEAINFGAATSLTGSQGNVEVGSGATLYVGSGGVNVVSANPYTTNFTANGGTIGAKAAWSSAVPVALASTSTFNAADASNTPFNITLSGSLSGAGGLTKIGGGTLSLGANNNYEGSTTISGGSLALGASGTLSSPTIINNGNFNVSSVTGGYTLGASQTISGTGTVTGDITVAGTLSPGNSPGTLSTGNQIWSNGGDYNWQIVNATGNAGTDFDTVAITGTLDLSALTTGQFDLNLWSLSSSGPDVGGNAANFNNLLTQSWTILTTSGGISGFEATDFDINVVANNGTTGFSNALGGGAFSLGESGGNLVLTFTAIPEPSAAFLSGIGILALLRRRRH